jgi:hypothetical protein
MKHLALATALVSAGLLTMPVAFAQQTPNTTTTQKDTSGAAAKQKAQSDPSGQYNFGTPGGQYSSRPAAKQRADGQTITGNNNMAGGSK